MLKRSGFMLALCVLALSACQKEITDPGANNILPPPDPIVDSCHITRSYYYGGSGGINDTADFVYNGLVQTDVIGSSADVHYSYDAGRLISMHYYEKPGNLLYHIDSFYYFNDSALSRIISHDYDMYNHFDTVHSILDFVYSGPLLSRVANQSWYEASTEIDTSYSDFTWANGNVTSIHFGDTQGIYDSIFYDYDTNLNYFNSRSPYFFMTDPFFQIHVGFEPHLPYFISRNNVVNFTIYGNIDYPVTYETDSLGHPTAVNQGGFEYMKYRWECP